MATNNLSRQIGDSDGAENQPIYRQLAYTLEAMIAKDYQPGSYLPSENELAESFGVNRHTVRRAMDDLVAAGFIIRQQGKGSLVINNQIEYAFDTGRFTASLDKLRLNTTSQVLKSDLIACNQKVADYLGVNKDDEVAVIETLRSVDDQPVSLITHFLNTQFLPDIEKSYQGGSLHEHIENNYDIRLKRTSALISAVMPNHDEVFYLKCSLARPLLKIKSFNSLQNQLDQVIEASVSRSRSDRFQIKI